MRAVRALTDKQQGSLVGLPDARSRKEHNSLKQHISTSFRTAASSIAAVPREMTDLATNDVNFLVEGARFGDLEDVSIALDQCRISPDSVDEQGRTGKCADEAWQAQRTLD